MEMETLQVKRTDFGKILETAEVLITEVEKALSQEEIVKKRLADVKEGRIEGKTEKELDDYLKKRGFKIG
ncbi:MAG TPA: hypothetical protein VJH95_05155 [Candidatus Nanoarchaeia archaeon]|nr:hypothetical protein [Candidatus Nanoarchaeia archaeon]